MIFRDVLGFKWGFSLSNLLGEFLLTVVATLLNVLVPWQSLPCKITLIFLSSFFYSYFLDNAAYPERSRICDLDLGEQTQVAGVFLHV